MLKTLVIVVLALTIFPVQAHPQTNKAEKTTQSGKPSPPVSTVAPQQTTGQHIQPAEEKHVKADVWVVSTPEKDGYDKTAFWVNMLLGLVGLGGVAAAGRTLVIMNRQTKAAENAAVAALLNAKAFINSERAWLTISIEKNIPPVFPAQPFDYVITNQGRTPATLKEIYIRHELFAEGNSWPVPPVYGEALELPKSTLVVKTQDSPIFPSFDPKREIGVRFKKRMLEGITQETYVCFGRIVYEDAIGGTDKNGLSELHETRWCYAWFASEEKFVRCGPEEYTGHT